MAPPPRITRPRGRPRPAAPRVAEPHRPDRRWAPRARDVAVDRPPRSERRQPVTRGQAELSPRLRPKGLRRAGWGGHAAGAAAAGRFAAPRSAAADPPPRLRAP